MRTKLVVASNRGPVSWRPQEGKLRPRRGVGGLVTALGGALQHEPGTWVSVAMSEHDRKIAAEHDGAPFQVDTGDARYTLRLLDVGAAFDPYYNEVANRLLWFTVHRLWDAPYAPAAPWSAAWHDGYVPVNKAVGRAVAEAAGDADAELYLQDYHLCLAGRTVRASLPKARILHYLHTPWPQPSDLRLLPDPVAEGILTGLLAADVVAFSAPAWAEAFRRCAAELAGAQPDGDAVVTAGRRTLVTDFTLGVDEDDLAASAAEPRTAAAGRRLDAERGDRRLLLRVDRTDLSKNILRGLRAYGLLLERHPEHRGRVWHYAHLNPSRQDVPEYRAYLEACQAAAEDIRRQHGDEAVTLFVGDDYPRAVAALQRYDVLLANPVRDGTNLVAKEGPVLNQHDGVLVLSRAAGAATVLSDAALMVNPFDIEHQAEALHAALTMPRDERARRAKQLRAAARIGPPHEWFAAQRATLRAHLPTP